MIKLSPFLCIERCDEGILVLDEKMGATSLISSPACVALELLGGCGDVDESDLIAQLASSNPLTDDSYWQDALLSLLKMGLVARC